MNASVAHALIERPATASQPAIEDRGVLRFITAGNVDDGKSTLIGRLLYDTRSILGDQLASLARAGQRLAVSTPAADASVDLALLTDGLEAEREQGITIDVAYRYFATARRKFIIADAPGHEQYTRNMVTGASTADAAVVLIDATRVHQAGDAVELLPQTRRHTALVKMLGIRHIVVAVNKLDDVDYPQQIFERVREAFAEIALQLGIVAFDAIPVSALRGDNVVRRSVAWTWYRGATLLESLESLDLAADRDTAGAPLRFAVQVVDRGASRAGAGARRYLGRIAAGVVRAGQSVRVLPSGLAARVAAIETFDRDLASAGTGQAVALRLDRELDVSRGDWVIAADGSQPTLSRLVRADLAWLAGAPLAPQRRLWIRHGTRFQLARVQRIEAVLDLTTGDWSPAAETLNANDIGRVVLETQQPLPFDPYERVRASGAAILIDGATQHTVAAAMLREAVTP